MTLTDHAPGILAALPTATRIGLCEPQIRARLGMPPGSLDATLARMTDTGMIVCMPTRCSDGIMRDLYRRRFEPGTLASARDYARTGLQATLITAETPAVQCGTGQVALTLF